MTIYRYVAFNRRGKEEKGIVDANSPAAARKSLRGQGLFVRSLAEDTEKKDRDLFPALTKFLYRVPRKDVGLFVRQLGTLIEAGIPLDRSLSNIIEQTENEYLKKALIEMKADIVEGESLSDAMRKQGAIFPAVYWNLVSVGEKTGTYEKALIRLADLEEANQAMRSKVVTALTYPAIMIVLLTGIVLFLLAFVFPQIKSLFDQLPNATLPLITRMVFAVSDFVTSWLVILPIAAAALSAFVFQKWRVTPEGRRKWERFQFKIPIIGVLRRKAILASFTRNLGVMLENRVPLIVSLQVVSGIVDHAIFSDETTAAIERIKEGSRISDAFRDSIVMNQMVLGMLSAGEASDRISDMVGRIADIMDGELDATMPSTGGSAI